MKLLLTGAFHYSESQIETIKELGYEIVFVRDERAFLNIETDDIEAVVCNALFLYNDIADFKNLKYIQLTSVGLDRIPVEYIEKQGIKLDSAAGVYSIPMAEWIVLKILEIYKNSRGFYQAQFERKWVKQFDLRELSCKTAAIIGFGRVGAETAKRLKAFGVQVTGVDTRCLSPEEACLCDGFCAPDDVNEALGRSDIIVLALPLTAYTRQFMNDCRFAAMKPGSVLVNVSRGGVVDETALIDYLKKDRFLGVALDVFEEEPLPSHSELWNFEKVIITPHNCYVSDKVNERLFELMVKNLRANLLTREGNVSG